MGLTGPPCRRALGHLSPTILFVHCSDSDRLIAMSVPPCPDSAKKLGSGRREAERSCPQIGNAVLFLAPPVLQGAHGRITEEDDRPRRGWFVPVLPLRSHTTAGSRPGGGSGGVGAQSLLHVFCGLDFFQQNYWLKTQINHTVFFPCDQ